MNISYVIRLIILLMLSTLYACGGGGSGDNDPPNISKATLDVTSELQTFALGGSGTLSAFVIVDGDTANRVEMIIDSNTASSATATIPSLSKALHTVVISYEYTDSTGTIVLATTSNTVDLSSGSATMDFATTDYDLASYDDDNDGVSNAAELAAGTNPRDGSCVIGISIIGSCTIG